MSELRAESQLEKEKAQANAVIHASFRPLLALLNSPIALYLSGFALVSAWHQHPDSDTVFHLNRQRSIAQ